MHACDKATPFPASLRAATGRTSSRWFCIGVPESRTRRRHVRLSSALFVFVSSFFRRCASSQTSRSTSAALANSPAWMRNVSYDTMSTSYGRGLERNFVTL